MRVLDLFSGIGGFSLGLERAGMATAMFCEIEPFCRRVLAKHWPGVPIHDDVRTLDRLVVAEKAGAVDLVCGGFPCQDISVAGKGAGLDGERSGLWFEYRRIIEEVAPRWVVIENVPALRSRGLDTVLGGLAALGYDAEWHCIPASALGAPHRRDRVWLVAHTQHAGRDAVGLPGHGGAAPPLGERPSSTTGGSGADVAHAARDMRAGTEAPRAERERTWPGGAGGGARNVAHANSDSRASGPLHADEGPGGWNAGGSGVGADVADAHHPRLEIVLNGASGQQPASVGAHAWAVEPGVGGGIDGFSAWLDRSRYGLTKAHKLLLAYANAQKAGPIETLRSLRHAIHQAVVRGEAGGSFGISSQAVLLAYLRQITAQPEEQEHLQLAGETAHQAGLRGLRGNESSARASCGSEHSEQRADEHPNALQAVSRLLARHAEAAWMAYRREDAAAPVGWETGIARVAHGVPSRVDRLRSLGNAVVPQVVEVIGRAIMAAEAGRGE